MLNITLKIRNDIYILLCIYFIYFIAFTLRKTYSFKNMSLHDFYIIVFSIILIRYL